MSVNEYKRLFNQFCTRDTEATPDPAPQRPMFDPRLNLR